jgi:hypothetical protein
MSSHRKKHFERGRFSVDFSSEENVGKSSESFVCDQPGKSLTDLHDERAEKVSIGFSWIKEKSGPHHDVGHAMGKHI